MSAAIPVEKPSDRIPYDLHPMSDETSMIATDALEEGVNQIIKLLNGRQTGLGGCAVPRTGKSHMIDYFIQHHPRFLKTTIPCFKFTMWSTEGAPPASKASFHTELLRLLRYPDYTKGTGIEKFGTVIGLLVTEAKRLQESRLLLFIDEAHRLRKAEFGFLVDIFNELRNNGIRQKTVLLGQPELRKKRSQLKGEAQIIQRFIPRLFEMRGVYSPEGLERIVRAIDDETEFPADSGWTYTYYYVPLAYENGFRLQGSNSILWEALEDAARECKLGVLEFTMQTVMEFLTELLLNLSRIDEADLAIDKATVRLLGKEAVEGQVVGSFELKEATPN